MRIALLVVAGCIAQKGPDRAQALRNCESISQSGQQVTQCLVLKYDWNADSAVPAGRRFQWSLDSLRADHERQAAAVLAEQQARAESIRMEGQIAGAHRAAPWVACILEQWRRGSLGSNQPEVPPTQLYAPCDRLLPSEADYGSYAARHRLRGDTAVLVSSSFFATLLERKAANP